MVYCTCSFAPEENESVINQLLIRVGESARILPSQWEHIHTTPGLRSWRGEKFHGDVSRCVRVIPNETMMGFFMCHIEKQDSDERP